MAERTIPFHSAGNGVAITHERYLLVIGVVKKHILSYTNRTFDLSLLCSAPHLADCPRQDGDEIGLPLFRSALLISRLLKRRLCLQMLALPRSPAREPEI
jgi:hypothetical protein